MSRDRFNAIKARIRFSPRGKASNRPHQSRDSGGFDRLWKVRPLLDQLQSVSEANFEPGTEVVGDEMMVKARGAQLLCYGSRAFTLSPQAC